VPGEYARRAVQPVTIEAVGQRFNAQTGQHVMAFHLGTLVPEQGPEATGITQAENRLREHQVDVVMLPAGVSGGTSRRLPDMPR
jgi:hypothetical protein